jgi:cation diffusion facilitator family transporter
MQQQNTTTNQVDPEALKLSKKIIVLTTFIDLGLGSLKIIVGWFANSHALIADGIHSFSDLATDVIVWFLSHIGRQEPDEDHPYGHARFETIGTVALGAILLVVAAALVYDSVVRLMSIESIQRPGWSALVAAALSFVVKEWLFRITQSIGKRIKSNLMIANAWHHRSDSFSSVIVFVGVGGALLGVEWLEMIAALGVAVMIGQIGWSLGRQSIQELVDTALSAEELEELQSSMTVVNGVLGIHSLRTRRMGNDVLVDIHIQVDPSISVSEGHQIGEWVSQKLISEFPHINDVIFHIDAEDDTEIEHRNLPYPMLPLRAEVRESLDKAWHGILDKKYIKKIILHYLNQRINVDVFVTRELLDLDGHDSTVLVHSLRESTGKLDWINRINVWYG